MSDFFHGLATTTMVPTQPIVLDYGRPDGSVMKRTVTTEPDGSFSDRYSPDISGVWNVTASGEGNEDYEGASMVTGFIVTAAPSWMAFGGYILVAAIAVVVIVSFVLFWRRRTRRPPVALEPVRGKKTESELLRKC